MREGKEDEIVGSGKGGSVINLIHDGPDANNGRERKTNTRKFDMLRFCLKKTSCMKLLIDVTITARSTVN